MSAPTGYKHREAFCLMQYRSDDGTESEQLWNSRDGVTPFILSSRNGKRMAHVEWNKDICDPYFTPRSGMRVFVDATEELVTPELKDYVEKIFTKHGGGCWKTPDEAFRALLSDWLHGGEAPWVIITP